MTGNDIRVSPWLLEQFADCSRRAAWLQWGREPNHGKGSGGAVTSSEIVRTVTRQAIADPSRPELEEAVGCSYHDRRSELGQYVEERVKMWIGNRKVMYSTTGGYYDRGGMESVIRRNIQNALLTLQLKWWHRDIFNGSAVTYEDELVPHLTTFVKAWQFTDNRDISRTLFIDVVGRWEDLYQITPSISPRAFDDTEEVHLLNILETPGSNQPWSTMWTLDGHQVEMYQVVRKNAAQRALIAHLAIDEDGDGPGAYEDVACNPLSKRCNNYDCPLFDAGCAEAMEVRRSAA